MDPLWERLGRQAVVTEAARQLQVAYCAAFDRADREALLPLFDPDAVFRRPDSVCAGRAAILDFYEHLWAAGTRPTRHFPVVVEVDEIGERLLRVRTSYFLILGHGDDLYVGWGDYDDRVAVGPQGLVFVAKTSTIEGLVRAEGGWGRASRTPPPWLPGRKTP
ncbi:nuclear transport factor 2 family protein [Polymorphospora sp. NPDC051019]|uniref:nuclear transport factor 2 family protein n=1 Tax=Polymorphospora sp. NPDC051019 TaxID=3155725 RepID=UPI00343C84D4